MTQPDLFDQPAHIQRNGTPEDDARILTERMRRSLRDTWSAEDLAACSGWGTGERGKRRVRAAAEASRKDYGPDRTIVSAPGKPLVLASRISVADFQVRYAKPRESQIRHMQAGLVAMTKAVHGQRKGAK